MLDQLLWPDVESVLPGLNLWKAVSVLLHDVSTTVLVTFMLLGDHFRLVML